MKRLKRLLGFMMAMSLVVGTLLSNNISAKAYDTGVPEFRGDIEVELENEGPNETLTKDSKIKITFEAWDDVEVTYAYTYFNLYTTDNKYSGISENYKYQKGEEPGSNGITKNGDKFTFEVSLDEFDYNGVIKFGYFTVKDAAGNTKRSYLDKAYTLTGSNELSPDESTNNDNFINDYKVEMFDVNGKKIEPATIMTIGSKVNFKVTVNETIPDNVDDFWMNIIVALDDVEAYRHIHMEDKGNNVYEGSYTFTSDDYPSVWCVSGINAYSSGPDDKGNWPHYTCSKVSSKAKDCFVIFKNGNQVVIPSEEIHLSVNHYVHEASDYWWMDTEIVDKTVAMGTEFKDLGLELPKTDGPEGISPEWHVYKWEWDSEKQADAYVDYGKVEDYTISRRDSWLYIMPYFEGYSVWQISCPEETLDGMIDLVYENVWIKSTSTENLKAQIDAFLDKYATKKLGKITYELSAARGTGVNHLYVKTEKVAFNIRRNVLAVEAGSYVTSADKGKSIILNKGEYPTVEQVKAEIVKLAVGEPSKVLGAKFDSWRVNTDADITQNIENAKEYGLPVNTVGWVEAKYDNEIYDLTYRYKDKNDDRTDIAGKTVLFDRGTSIETVKEYAKSLTVKGYSGWTIEEAKGPENDRNGYIVLVTENESTIKAGAETVTSATGEEIPIETKVEEQKIEIKADGKVQVTQKVEIGIENTITENGVTKLDKAAKAMAIDMISQALEETKAQVAASKTTETPKVTLKMADATVIPTEILEAAKGQDVDVVFDMGDGISWTVNGNDINGESLKDVNLKVNKNTNNVPKKIIESLVGNDEPTIQINLADHGLFGFKADLRIYVGKEYADKYANLIYYTSDGRLEVQNSNKVDADGYATLTFTHASDYVISMGRKLAASPNTGDVSLLLIWLQLLAIGLTMVVLNQKKKA